MGRFDILSFGFNQSRTAGQAGDLRGTIKAKRKYEYGIVPNAIQLPFPRPCVNKRSDER